MMRSVVTAWLAGESQQENPVLVTDGVFLVSFGITIGITDKDGFKCLCPYWVLEETETWMGNRRRIHWSIARYIVATQ